MDPGVPDPMLAVVLVVTATECIHREGTGDRMVPWGNSCLQASFIIKNL